MAVLRIFKGSILEENIARTAGSIGESVAAGAVFTIPAFVISRSWLDFSPGTAYWKSTALMMIGSILGVLFVSLVRRVLVEDPDAAVSRIGGRIADPQGRTDGRAGRQISLLQHGVRARPSSSPAPSTFSRPIRTGSSPVGNLGQHLAAPGRARIAPTRLATGGVTVFSGPTISPAYIGVGYVIGPTLAALNFSGSIIAWGLLIPLLIYFLGPQLQSFLPANATDESWLGIANARLAIHRAARSPSAAC